ncbi:YbgC/YbaW family acyl-CoA thioester hydrolase [Bacillus sp. SLBN-46]|uniref:acyl-CoA thioesterase n=1 Tax=Bacillus sp. SLBN-46 TaxID=3042283 RepID=UPI002859E710|nr:thioesterase family protein [Bacillus sp. SLBN-46]MDR6120484.1 YbgC/YbaW family acyl-CoA thioester hydrolase [Bacillus sp. SLBN-46]
MAYSELFIVAEANRGHVSNVKLFEYLDEGRKWWYRYCVSHGVEAVVVHIGVDYKKEVFNHDRLWVQTSLERIGNTSFTLKQTITNEQQEQMVVAEVVLTTINRQTRRKVPVPDEVRNLLNRHSNLTEEYSAGRKEKG